MWTTLNLPALQTYSAASVNVMDEEKKFFNKANF